MNKSIRREGLPTIVALIKSLKSEQRFMRKNYSKEELTEDDFCGVDVRLRIRNGNWFVHTGSSDYDQDHRGHWGASALPYGRTNLKDLALDLLGQVRESFHESVSRKTERGN